MTKEQIIEKLQILIKDYTPDCVQKSADDIENLWLKSDNKRETRLVKAELQEKLHIAGVNLDILKAMGKTIGKQAKGNEADILPLARELWDNHQREGRIVSAYLLGAIVIALPEAVFALSFALAKSTVSWEDADNMIMSIEPAVRKNPDVYFPWLDKWFVDPCKWVRRIAITITGRLAMKHKDYTGTCLEKILINIEDEDPDVRRATSFAIRLSTRGDLKEVITFLKKNAGGAGYGKIWVYADVIRSMTKKFLPDCKKLLPVYKGWQSGLTEAKAIRSLDAAIKLLEKV